MILRVRDKPQVQQLHVSVLLKYLKKLRIPLAVAAVVPQLLPLSALDMMQTRAMDMLETQWRIRMRVAVVIKIGVVIKKVFL